jgi:hypothetical protein
MSDKSATYSKIASAVYLVTGFFADQEPLKWRLRSLAGDLASEQFHNKPGVSRELTALFGLARAAGLVSDTNYDILVGEFGKIAASSNISLAALPESPRNQEALPASAPEPAAVAPTAPAQPPRPAPVVRDNFIERKPEERPDLKEFGAVSVKKNSRQSTIIALLKRKKEIMIKDVSPLIPGCSEKTIQRELAEMVEEGILRKMGDKRWTRYTLAQ